jgi:hypothetical protein
LIALELNNVVERPGDMPENDRAVLNALRFDSERLLAVRASSSATPDADAERVDPRREGVVRWLLLRSISARSWFAALTSDIQSCTAGSWRLAGLSGLGVRVLVRTLTV